MKTQDLSNHLQELNVKPQTSLDIMTEHAQKLEDRISHMLEAARSAEKPSGSAPGFAVVGLHASLGYTPVTNPLLARGFRFEEIWIFGHPRTFPESELSQAVARIVAQLPAGMVHRIPEEPWFLIEHPTQDGVFWTGFSWSGIDGPVMRFTTRGEAAWEASQRNGLRHVRGLRITQQ